MYIEKALCGWDADKHIYSYNGIQIPSVTQILSPLNSAAFADINPSILQQAAARGTAVHEYCELRNIGIDTADIELNPECIGFYSAYERFMRDYKPQWDFVEQRLYGAKNDMMFAGTVDQIGWIDGHPAIVDWKTTASPNRAEKIKWACQLYGYAKLHVCNGFKPEKPYILMDVQLKKDGSYAVHNMSDTAEKYCFSVEKLFSDLLQQWWIVNGKKKVK